MKQLTVLVVVLSFVAPSWATAQGFHGESEGGHGGDTSNPAFVHQYFFYEGEGWNALGRPFWVDGVLKRMEVAVGPTFLIGDSVVQLQFGATTEKQGMIAGLALTNVAGYEIMYIGDGKVGWDDDWSSSYYQKLFVSLDQVSDGNPGRWYVRLEHLSLVIKGIGVEQAFFRAGLEFRIQRDSSGRRHFFLAPFWDFVTGRPGGQAGFRF